VDGNARKMQVGINASEPYLVLPHFWNYVLIDPGNTDFFLFFSCVVSN
jgi:hypothetical protein